MAPSLSTAIREGLQRKQVPPENIALYLSKLGNLPRYDKAFQCLWNFCVSGGGDPPPHVF
jgi:hypothetical protein